MKKSFATLFFTCAFLGDGAFGMRPEPEAIVESTAEMQQIQADLTEARIRLLGKRDKIARLRRENQDSKNKIATLQQEQRYSMDMIATLKQERKDLMNTVAMLQQEQQYSKYAIDRLLHSLREERLITSDATDCMNMSAEALKVVNAHKIELRETLKKTKTQMEQAANLMSQSEAFSILSQQFDLLMGLPQKLEEELAEVFSNFKDKPYELGKLQPEFNETQIKLVELTASFI
jgi:hypothetical protein